MFLYVLIIIVLFLVILWFVNKFLSRFKIPKLNSLVMVTGGVKCGKSTLSVHMAIKTYKRRVRSTKFVNFFRRIFKKPEREIPLLYSNVPLAIPYVPVTLPILMRRQRVVFGSVVYLQEASLVADSQLIKDKYLNNQLLLFFKLWGHSSHGGICVLDSQTCSDLHYSCKRSLSEYFYVHHLVRWIPFFLVAYVIENRYSDDGTIVTAETQDVEEQYKRVIIPKRTWKYFDTYCYSPLTDDLPVSCEVVHNDLKTKDLKAYNIVSFRPEFNVEKECKDEKKNTK